MPSLPPGCCLPWVHVLLPGSPGLPVEVDAASTRTNVDGGEATNATTDVTATVAATSPSIVLSAALGGGPAAAGVVLAANVTDTESVTAPGNVTALLPPSAHNSTSAEAAPGFDGKCCLPARNENHMAPNRLTKGLSASPWHQYQHRCLPQVWSIVTGSMP